MGIIENGASFEVFSMDDSILHLDGQTLAVVDVETTGLSAFFGDRVCEVGIVRAQGDEVLDTYQTLVNPQRPISPGARRVNGLSDEDVSQAPLFAEIAGEVIARIDGALLVCHNAPFDLGFLDAELSRLGRPWQPAGVIDTLAIARSRFHFGSNSLSAVAASLGIETAQAHRALGDALTTFQVFRKLYRRLVHRGVLQGMELVGSHHPASLVMDEGLLPPSIQEALAGNSAIQITYLDAQGNETSRRISPLRVQAGYDAVYLVAFCHLRQAERSFRLDRIVAIGT
jgi:DNA polymerase III epsilon subunit family exonuclease